MYWLEFAGEADGLAALEATTAASDLTVLGPGVATATDLVPTRIKQLGFLRAAGTVIARSEPTVDRARQALASAQLSSRDLPSTSANTPRPPTVAVRARDVRGTTGIDTQALERALGSVLVDAGFDIDLETPDHRLRVVCTQGRPDRDPAAEPTDPADPLAGDRIAVRSDPVCVLGWEQVRPDRSFAARRPTDRPFFQPGSMDPMLARTCVSLSGVSAGHCLLDPMCGTGGTLIEGGLIGAHVVGLDVQAQMVAGARQNLAAAGEWTGLVLQGDARQLPFAAESFDGFVVDVPYGRQSAIAARDREDLVTGVLAELARVAPRGVLVGDQDWRAHAEAAGWTITAVVRRRIHSSLVRYLHVLTRPDVRSAPSLSATH